MVAVLFRLLLIGALVWVAWRLWPVVRNALARLDSADGPPPPPPGPRLVAIERTPHDVLGVDEDATTEEIREAWERIVAQNSPDRVAEMSPEVQELAARLVREATAAYRELTGH